ncbi:adenine nucleotide alpha hydrolase family protein [Megalodesulfovibrio gigas]|uniref:Putative UspA domain-containing protein n=1 Tax=Megalodesulfovibrio gigas (strain ATCC 19364 / DSM 1382 / NCIMB 9332 / VKM B-1759) TaxID=1121448 RepID=T2GDD7_MEGG1|nr:universal stress protein [Megalodesulfovibrio gigas]AGW14570.1 putative UspA domain-containing protein [Megalodesulfovibrio gigas DSM 1382 = ATCC 19364]
MEKHLLLTVSADREASSNLRFIRHFFDALCDLRITLFYVASRPMDQEYHFVPSALETGHQRQVPVEEIKSPEAREALQHAREWLVAEGCGAGKIETKAVYSRFGTVHDIIQEGHAGKYDAVVLGKRCVSWFEELLDDSATNRILQERIDFPVWICRRPETGLSRDVLLCLDGSEASMRMADHVGFMLGSAPRHRVQLLHVRTRAEDRSAAMFQTAREALLENGVNPQQIHEKVVASDAPAQTILQEARQGHYAVVALGRRSREGHGGEPTRQGKSVTQNLLHLIEDFALWISK